MRGRILLLDVLAGGPADQAGLEPLDVLVSVAGTDLSRDPSVAKAGELLRGASGSEVTVQVRRGDVELSHRLRRTDLESPAVFGRVIDPVRGIGILWIQAFSSHTARDLDLAIVALREAGAKGIVLDLRGNLGGVLDAAVAVASRFIDGGLILTTRGRSTEKRYEAPRAAPDSNMPLAVLVDRRSASASEVLAAALQDHGRAPLIGERTYGKGVVQSKLPFSSGWSGGLKITTAHCFTPAGRCIERDVGIQRGSEDDRGGLIPDIPVVLDKETESRADRARERIRYTPPVVELLAREEGLDSSWMDPALETAVMVLTGPLEDSRASRRQSR